MIITTYINIYTSFIKIILHHSPSIIWYIIYTPICFHTPHTHIWVSTGLCWYTLSHSSSLLLSLFAKQRRILCMRQKKREIEYMFVCKTVCRKCRCISMILQFYMLHRMLYPDINIFHSKRKQQDFHYLLGGRLDIPCLFVGSWRTTKMLLAHWSVVDIRCYRFDIIWSHMFLASKIYLLTFLHCNRSVGELQICRSTHLNICFNFEFNMTCRLHAFVFCIWREWVCVYRTNIHRVKTGSIPMTQRKSMSDNAVAARMRHFVETLPYHTYACSMLHRTESTEWDSVRCMHNA